MPARSNPSASTPRWYPHRDQLRDPDAAARTMKQVLDQLYALQDSHDALKKQVAAMPASTTPAAPPGSGPANTKLLGLNVEPVDTKTLTNSMTLKYNPSRGTFSFQ